MGWVGGWGVSLPSTGGVFVEVKKRGVNPQGTLHQVQQPLRQVGKADWSDSNYETSHARTFLAQEARLPAVLWTKVVQPWAKQERGQYPSQGWGLSHSRGSSCLLVSADAGNSLTYRDKPIVSW